MADFVARKITLKGLRGGHSGLEINEGRGNANKLLARIVHDLLIEFDSQLASFEGGNMRNAIPAKHMRYWCSILRIWTVWKII